ncbi:MAG: hypothetical protein WC551_09935 [Patescibacteria group bacterium]
MRRLWIGLVIVLLLALAGLALSQTVLKSLPVHVTVTSNQNVGVYSDETATTEVTGWYMGNVKRGTSINNAFWIKNLGEPVELTISVNGPDWVTVTPATATLATGQVIQCNLSVAPPLSAPLGEVSASIEIKGSS